MEEHVFCTHTSVAADGTTITFLNFADMEPALHQIAVVSAGDPMHTGTPRIRSGVPGKENQIVKLGHFACILVDEDNYSGY